MFELLRLLSPDPAGEGGGGAPDPGAAEATPPAGAEDPTSAPGEATEPAAQEAPDAIPEGSTPSPPRDRFQDRIDKITAKGRASEERAEATERENHALNERVRTLEGHLLNRQPVSPDAPDPAPDGTPSTEAMQSAVGDPEFGPTARLLQGEIRAGITKGLDPVTARLSAIEKGLQERDKQLAKREAEVEYNRDFETAWADTVKDLGITDHAMADEMEDLAFFSMKGLSDDPRWQTMPAIARKQHFSAQLRRNAEIISGRFDKHSADQREQWNQQLGALPGATPAVAGLDGSPLPANFNELGEQFKDRDLTDSDVMAEYLEKSLEIKEREGRLTMKEK